MTRWLLLTLAAACGHPSPSVADAQIQMPDAIELPDTSTASVQDAGCALVMNDIGESPETWPAGYCFQPTAPQADAFVLDVPMPQTCSCASEPLPDFWFKDQLPPPPTLLLSLGIGDELTQNFVDYRDGDWAPIVLGGQGNIMIWGGVRVVLKGVSDAKRLLWFHAYASEDCVKVAESPTRSWFRQTAADFEYTNFMTTQLGGYVIFSFQKEKGYLFCGKWVQLHVRIYDDTLGQWGESKVMLRLYDSRAATP